MHFSTTINHNYHSFAQNLKLDVHLLFCYQPINLKCTWTRQQGKQSLRLYYF